MDNFEKKEETYGQYILKPELGESRAEEEYVTKEHLEAYEAFVTKVQGMYKLETREQAQSKAQELIVNYQQREKEAREGNRTQPSHNQGDDGRSM